MVSDGALEAGKIGKAGHALEVAVSELFHYSGFEIKRNEQTRYGEIDVVASTGPYTVIVECKEYDPVRSALVIRDMISNIAKKTELLGFKNALLITTKPPTSELVDYAREAGVVVRSLDDLNKLRSKWATVADKKQLLIDGFHLTANDQDAAVRRRRLFLEQWVRNPSKALAKKTAADTLYRIRFYLLGLGIGLLVAVALGFYFVPDFGTMLLTAVVTIVGVPVIAWYMWKQNKGEKGRKKRRSS